MNLALLPNGAMPRIVTIEDRNCGDSSWRDRFSAWPNGATHIDIAVDTDAQRNLFGVQLDRAVAQADRAVLLIARGAGCMATAWWARLSPANYVSRVTGALLFAPDTADCGHQSGERFASPRIHLPFPSIVIDELASPQDRSQLATLAQGWGSRLLDEDTALLPGDRADEQATSPWSQINRIVRRWSAAVVEHDARTAEALAGRRSLITD